MSLKSCLGLKVKAYRNLNKDGYFSIKTDKVVGYTTGLMIIDCKFTAQCRAQQKIQDGEPRSVHAYAVGVLSAVDISALPDNLVEVTYTPKTRSGFYIKSSGVTVTEADVTYLINCKMYCLNPR